MWDIEDLQNIPMLKFSSFKKLPRILIADLMVLIYTD